MNKKYTSEHIEFFRVNTPGRTYKELTALFNERFGTNLPVSTVTSASFRYGFKNGRDAKFNNGYEPTQFKKGHIPHNKGKKGIRVSPATEFKKGHIPANYRPIGSERIGKSRSNLGYTEVKVADPKKWRMKHVVIWEAAHGTVPKGHCVIFADRDKTNFSIDNLLLVTRSELARMNQNGYIYTNAELTKSGHIMAKIEIAIGERKRGSKK